MEKQRPDAVGKLLKISACKELPICSAYLEFEEPEPFLHCQGKICAMVGKKEECAESVAKMASWLTCKKLGTAERCEIERKSNVCLEENPKLCVDVIEHKQMNCTEEEGDKRLCKTKSSKTVRMGTEELCTDESQERWQECSVDEHQLKACMQAGGWTSYNLETIKKQEQECTISAQVCTNLQEKEALERLKVLLLASYHLGSKKMKKSTKKSKNQNFLILLFSPAT